MPNNPEPPSDPVFLSSLRELKWIIAIWAISFVWVIGYCSLFGYEVETPIALTLGMPSWAFWGIFVPWGIASVASCWFALTQMQDHAVEGESDTTAGETEAVDG